MVFVTFVVINFRTKNFQKSVDQCDCNRDVVLGIRRNCGGYRDEKEKRVWMN